MRRILLVAIVAEVGCFVGAALTEQWLAAIPWGVSALATWQWMVTRTGNL